MSASARFAYVRPRGLEEALRHLQDEGAYVHAGGTDLHGCLNDGVFDAQLVVSLSDVPGIDEITERPDGGIEIGAAVTLTEVALNGLLQDRYPGLAAAAETVASPQIRNQGTLGGNLAQKPRCWYYRGDFRCLRKGGSMGYALEGENAFHCILGGDACVIVHPSDTAPALAALGATLLVAGPEGVREVPVDAFHVPPEQDPRRETVLEKGELIAKILLPAPAPGTRSAYRKVRARGAWDFALAGIALAVRFDGDKVDTARIFLSGVAPIPWRARGAEAAIQGQALTDDVIAKAAEAAVDGAEPLAQNGYKVQLVRGIVTEQLEALRA